MTQIRRAVHGDVERLAALHAASLPSSLVTALGERALVRFYAFLDRSPTEHVFATEDLGTLIGGCVVSDEPHTMLGRFARHAPLQLARELALQALRDAGLRARLIARLRTRGSAGDPAHAPELTQIFTDVGWRGRGIGAQLLRTCEADLRARGQARYFVHTQRDGNEAGIRFYQRDGFVTIGESVSFGDALLVMQKELT